MKNALIICTVGNFLNFELNDIKILNELGYKVYIASNFSGCDAIMQKLASLNTVNIQIGFARSPFSLDNLKATKQLVQVFSSIKFDLVHCHTPVGGVLGRLVGNKFRKDGMKVIYTAHGFHFFKGAPFLNWLLYYPIEKIFSYFTDILITINKEDFELSKKQFNAKITEYIPSVGVYTDRFSNSKMSKCDKRKELGIPQDAFLMLSVGELSSRKNHILVINALGQINDPNIFYIIAGDGKLHNEYIETAKKHGIEKQVFLLGNRSDINELCKAADLFIHPSAREGLGIAPLEGMAAGLPLISTYINGIKDYTENNITGCCIESPYDVMAMVNSIIKMKTDRAFRDQCSANNIKIAGKFDIRIVEQVMRNIYEKISN